MADNFIVKDGNGATLTKASKDIGSGVQADKVMLVDAGGATLAALGIDQTAPGTTNKVAIGSDGKVTLRQDGGDIGVANPLAVTGADTTGSGAITTQNLVPAGVATAGSAVEVSMADKAALAVQVTGSYSGALSIQGTVDGTTWVTLGNAAMLISAFSNTSGTTIPSGATGIWVVMTSGFAKLRLTALAAVTGTATVTLRAVSSSASGIGLQMSGQFPIGFLSGGSGVIGAVVPSMNVAIAPTMAATKLIAAASTNATVVKSSNGVVVGGSVTNLSAATKYLKFYNKASAPTVGTDVPVLTLPVPAGQTLLLEGFFGAIPPRFITGIAFALTGAAADSDTTALAAGDVIVNILYF